MAAITAQNTGTVSPKIRRSSRFGSVSASLLHLETAGGGRSSVAGEKAAYSWEKSYGNAGCVCVGCAYVGAGYIGDLSGTTSSPRVISKTPDQSENALTNPLRPLWQNSNIRHFPIQVLVLDETHSSSH